LTSTFGCGHTTGLLALPLEISMRRICLALPFTALVLGPLAPSIAGADDIREQLELAIELYEEGDYAGTVTELQFAIGEIKALLSGTFAETFPPAPAGWTAAEPSQEAAAGFMGGGTIVNRSYSEDGGSGSMEAQLIIDNPMIQGMAALFNNPAMLAANPNMQRVRMGRENAILEFDEAAGRGEITFMAGGGRAMLKVEGRGLASSDQLVDLLQAWDMAGLRAAAGL
jgi:hypothetical protein